MRPAFQAIRLLENRSFRCWHTYGSSPAHVPWHFHPEVELIFIESSYGLQFVGDSVQPFQDGDLLLLGSNLPHAWLHNKKADVRLAIAHFREDSLNRILSETPEFAQVTALLRNSRRGVHFPGAIAQQTGKRLIPLCGIILESLPGAMKVDERMIPPPKLTDAERLLGLLGILEQLARSPEQKLLSSADYVPDLNSSDAGRINAVCRYVQDNLTGIISQSKAAALVHMSTGGFSFFFRKKMGRTFSAYVNQLRIAHATQLLREAKMSISEACFASGYSNLSNFNQHFRTINGMNPSAFRRRFQSVMPATNASAKRA